MPDLAPRRGEVSERSEGVSAPVATHRHCFGLGHGYGHGHGYGYRHGCGYGCGYGYDAAPACYHPRMPSNIEIKAKLRDREAVESLVRARSDHGPELIIQEDVFFPCESGRLKLRAFSDDRGELIFYRRLDTEGPTQSDFFKAPTADPAAMATAMKAALGEVGTVRKRRTLYLVGQTRIHLDEVDGLGDWIELEVVLEPGQSSDDGARIARDLMAALGIEEADLEARAYVDLLTAKAEDRS